MMKLSAQCSDPASHAISMFRLLHIVLLCLFTLCARCEVDVPPLKGRITDLTGTLTADQRAALESRLAAFEARTGSQLAVLLVATTQPESIEQYSIRVVDKWKLGRKRIDDGVLLLVAKSERKMRIEVGYGLEGALPDAVAKRIIADAIAPHFKQGDFHGGIAAGIDKIVAAIDGEAPPQSHWELAAQSVFDNLYSYLQPSERTKRKWFGIAFLFGLGALIWGAVRIAEKHGRLACWLWVVSWLGTLAGLAAWRLDVGAVLQGVREWFIGAGIMVAVCCACLLGLRLREILGRYAGGMANGGLIWLLVWLLGGEPILAGGLAIVAFLVTLSSDGGARAGSGGYSYDGGSSDYATGGYSGGGGDFGGGGASGDW